MRVICVVLIMLFSPLVLCCELIVRIENFKPEATFKVDQSWEGVDVQFIDKLLRQVGCEYSIVQLPWIRSLEMLENGDIDMMINVTKTRPRAKVFHFLGPIRDEVIVFAQKVEDDINLNKVSDLATLTKPFAIQRGAFYGSEIQKLRLSQRTKNSFIEVVDNDSKLLLLQKGRISGFLEAKRNLTIGPEKKPRYKGIWYHPMVINQSPIYIALSKKSINEPLLTKLQEALTTQLRK